MSLTFRLYLIGAVLAAAALIGAMYHYYSLGASSALRTQENAIHKLTVKNRKADAKINKSTPDGNKRAALEWLSKSVRE